MANVSKLLYSTADVPCFLKNLQLDDADHVRLRDARKKIRQRLRDEFAKVSKTELGVVVRPRFFTQGSYAYNTINEPAWTPPQQMDLDDGAYLPMTFVQGAKPSVAAAAFFGVVDKALKELARQENWKFVERPTCARVIISADAHVDVPLYAIPDAQFVLLEKAVEGRLRIAMDARADSIDRWDALPSECVLLAHREDDWKISDPRKINDWFVQAVEIYGERLRRVCRYLKAWRDHNRPDLDAVTSIMLMVCVWKVFEEIGRPQIPDRDDLALFKVAERLPQMFEGPICNPTDSNSEPEQLDSRLADKDRRAAIDMAKQLKVKLQATIQTCFDPKEAIGQLTVLFGTRIPNRPDMVDVAKAAYAEVRSHAVRMTPAVPVGKSISA